MIINWIPSSVGLLPRIISQLTFIVINSKLSYLLIDYHIIFSAQILNTLLLIKKSIFI